MVISWTVCLEFTEEKWTKWTKWPKQLSTVKKGFKIYIFFNIYGKHIL